MTQIFGLTTLFIWLGEVLLIIAFVAAVCFYYLRCRNRNRVEAAAAAAAAAAAFDRRQQAAAPRAQPAAAVQMAPMALVLRLDRVSVTYTRRNGGGTDDRRQQPSVAEAEQDCAICLSPFQYGDRCSVMHVCRHEFHRSCIAKWLACHNHNTCPLCRAQLRWDDVAINMP